jgi:membrane protease YdiL (CAAX protease family)
VSWTARVARLFVTAHHRPALLWRLAGFLLLFFALPLVREKLQLFLYSLAKPVEAAAFVAVGIEGLVLAVYAGSAIVLTYLFRRFVDRRPWSGMALPRLGCRWRAAVVGWSVGMAMMASALGVELAMGWVSISRSSVADVGIWQAVAQALALLVYFSGTGFAEELAHRGYLFQNVGESYPIWFAALAPGVVFGLAHFSSKGFSTAFVAAAAVMTTSMVVARLQTGSLWWGIGWHIGWDWGEAGVFGLVGNRGWWQLDRHGPALWTGAGQAIEGGLLFLLLLATALVAFMAWGWLVNRWIAWNSILDADGRPIPRCAEG